MESATGGRYRRIGTVVAQRLEAARDWQTSSGEVLRAAGGDWWVVSWDGRGRSVTPEAFLETYEHIEGDTYRRRGEVTARQAERREVVTTLEGDAVAHPGMWIVTDASLRSWPVPDQEFRRGYEAV